MKKRLLLILALTMTVTLSACGMSAEEITTYMTSLETSYQNGAYEQAQSELQKLAKSEKNMTDEQKSKFDELKSSVEYAVSSSDAINEGLNNAQSQLDQKMYYEAEQALDKLSTDYKLPPTEQKKFDEEKSAAENGIKSVKVTEALNNVENIFNSGNYESAEIALSGVDTSNMNDTQSLKYQSLIGDIANAKANKAAQEKAEAERKARESVISADQALSIAQQQFPSDIWYLTYPTTQTFNGEEAYYIEATHHNARRGIYVNKHVGGIMQIVELP